MWFTVGAAGDAAENDDEVPDLVENFDEASKAEGPTKAALPSDAAATDALPSVDGGASDPPPAAAPDASSKKDD